MKFSALLALAVASASLCASPANAQTWNAERHTGGGGTVTYSDPMPYGLPSNFDDLSYDDQMEYLSKLDKITTGASDQEQGMISDYWEQVLEQQHSVGSRYDFGLPSGEDFYEVGCLINGTFFPENGGCLENEWNRQRYDQARDMNGGGVLLPTESPINFDEYLPD